MHIHYDALLIVGIMFYIGGIYISVDNRSIIGVKIGGNKLFAIRRKITKEDIFLGIIWPFHLIYLLTK